MDKKENIRNLIGVNLVMYAILSVAVALSMGFMDIHMLTNDIELPWSDLWVKISFGGAVMLAMFSIYSIWRLDKYLAEVKE